MGVYLNSKKPFLLFQEDRLSRYFVDKSSIIEDLIPILDCTAPFAQPPAPDKTSKDIKYICITRPRRFGKTMAANMISSYFGKSSDSSALFQGLAVSSCRCFAKHLNQHNVIHLMLNELPDACTTYAQYISRIKKRLLKDLIREFPDVPIEKDDTLWDALNSIIEFGTGEKFIFILDEWDFIFHRDFITSRDKAAYIDFLNNLLKDQPYVELAYMTGILPIAKYSSGSELNMFCEYAMASEEKYAESPLLHYSTEAELTMIVNMAFLSARDSYGIEREDNAGTGFVDFIFYPLEKNDDCIILELKVNHTAEEAVQQIKDRGYALNFQGKPGEQPKYDGRILAVGIACRKKDKNHSCKIEVLS